jgi:hypothetical protein
VVKVVSEVMTGIGCRRFVGVGIRGRSSWAIAPAARGEPAEEGFEERTEEEWGECVSLQGAYVSISGWDGAVGVVCSWWWKHRTIARICQ